MPTEGCAYAPHKRRGLFRGHRSAHAHGMHTIKTSIRSILRYGLHRACTPETPRALGDWILRDMGLSRKANGRSIAEHDNASGQTVLLRAFYGL